MDGTRTTMEGRLVVQGVARCIRISCTDWVSMELYPHLTVYAIEDD